jgi:hypothetical protein
MYLLISLITSFLEGFWLNCLTPNLIKISPPNPMVRRFCVPFCRFMEQPLLNFYAEAGEFGR